jgi:hypothetical protein
MRGHVWDEGKAVGCVPPTALLFERAGRKNDDARV